jgi:hypothetical protein
MTIIDLNQEIKCHEEGDYSIIEISCGIKKYYYRNVGYRTVYPNGFSIYHKNGTLHREDGPAIERPDGHQEWRLNGLFHRTDGPALIDKKGNKKWYCNGELHRTDGPAIEMISGRVYYYLQGKRIYSVNKFNRLVKLQFI